MCVLGLERTISYYYEVMTYSRPNIFNDGNNDNDNEVKAENASKMNNVEMFQAASKYIKIMQAQTGVLQFMQVTCMLSH